MPRKKRIEDQRTLAAHLLDLKGDRAAELAEQLLNAHAAGDTSEARQREADLEYLVDTMGCSGCCHDMWISTHPEWFTLERINADHFAELAQFQRVVHQPYRTIEEYRTHTCGHHDEKNPRPSKY